ncbi:RNA-directed DNA polymerase, eukaryota, Reverse transcriptase zinc-binding domain protein [Artemisia annua]|uniref:RNA-directed DNA polymerase, eukaryota, Reverse transcriptase zinc-binding domain protein n=1 Tax=Artemisia annua TaxID=35608 RepID=A0A2U1P7H6_ARTAN|nr:RNA-directed DNA polymerase, eukaryota, Reverse transcriptase zinc-binding domain protein [Artemisia annua]
MDLAVIVFQICSVIGVLKAIAKLKTKGVDLMEFCKLVIGNGNSTKFWHDKWYGDVFFKDKRRPRSGIEESQFLKLSQFLSLVVLSSSSDHWSWTLNGLGDFSVNSTRKEIDKHVLVISSSPIRWSKVLPIKLNIYLWRMFLDKLHTRTNLSNRGLDISCTLCPNYGIEVETRNHLFFGCSVTLDLFRLLGRWWSIQIRNIADPISWETWFNDLNFNSLRKQMES